MLRAIREVQPRWVVGENVRGLTNWNGGLVFDEVQADLENEGYEVTPYLLPACAVDAPHRRDRIWFVAYRNEGSTRPPGTSGGVKGEWRENNDEPELWREQTKQHNGRGELLRPTQNTDQVRRNGVQPEGKPGEREQREPGTGNHVRLSIASNAEETRSPALRSGNKTEYAVNGDTCCNWPIAHPCEARHEGGEQYGAFATRNGREQPPRPTSKLYKAGDWQQFPTQSPVCGRNDGFPGGLAGITFPKWREFAIGALGNAIVPQVAFEIFKAINEYEKLTQ